VSKLNIFNTLALVLFCFAIGEGVAILLTSVVFSRGTTEVLEVLRTPTSSERYLIMFKSVFSSLLRFLIVPGLYLFIVNKKSLDFLKSKNRMWSTPLLLSIALVVSILPIISLLIEFNSSISLPSWLSKAETYFKEVERLRQQMTSVLFLFTGVSDLIMMIVVAAIIPGVVEELFFRGVIQTQFQNTLINHHSAIFFSAFIFSAMHFQFYGFIPRMILGLILGYMFYWSKNIWYPVLAHITNNTLGVLGIYFFGREILHPENGTLPSIPFVVISLLVTIFIISRLRQIFYLHKV
jgi:membrane protease YdiL (CAAX protease family)